MKPIITKNVSIVTYSIEVSEKDFWRLLQVLKTSTEPAAERLLEAFTEGKEIADRK